MDYQSHETHEGGSFPERHISRICGSTSDMLAPRKIHDFMTEMLTASSDKAGKREVFVIMKHDIIWLVFNRPAI